VGRERSAEHQRAHHRQPAAGGTYTLYCPRNNSSNVNIVGNRFGNYQYGSSNSCVSGHVAQFSGNVRDSDGGALGAG
jgi:hypothetical protein